ncbi:MAG: nucleoside triphosphate pyrophosphohydrolase [Pseudomonadota bacterium]
MKKTAELFLELIDIIRTLRSPRGCPWDRKQTPADVKAYLIEELHEVLEAVDMDEKDLLAEETGDLFFLVLFLVNLYEEKKYFSLYDALSRIKTKMIHRHPHVFGSTDVSSAEEVKENWQILKEQEGKKPKNSFLDGIPGNLPSLSRAYFLTSKAAGVGFDWPSTRGVLEKVKEEIEELEAACAAGKKQNMTDEIGDVLFSIVNLGRHLGIEPEQALQRANKKFIKRFAHIEKELKKNGVALKQATLEEMDRLWNDAKTMEKSGTGER